MFVVNDYAVCFSGAGIEATHSANSAVIVTLYPLCLDCILAACFSLLFTSAFTLNMIALVVSFIFVGLLTNFCKDIKSIEKIYTVLYGFIYLHCK